MKKIFSVILAIELLFGISTNVFAEDFANNELNNQNTINISKYAKEFVDTVSGNINLEIGDIKQLYDEKVADGWNNYLRYINFNGYDYNRKDGWSFSISE